MIDAPHENRQRGEKMLQVVQHGHLSKLGIADQDTDYDKLDVVDGCASGKCYVSLALDQRIVDLETVKSRTQSNGVDLLLFVQSETLDGLLER